ncbi:protein of unknown function DUF397 [Alloactinosynnema sp. L-07]|uniref:DUF397 domain-containing protein n=1 Tax=Alloactinosynnema sp. L-07 TaxID=1653480 RepID=UPI00065EF455|nr:DUF397 domain-containing protein [Alloactinosynnema sp. L-07]CRK59937.1 protein of unknown function DUF397 [Alloactinosynnema sp. L-07]
MTAGHDFSRAQWRKSSRSSGNNGNCVELAVVADAVGVRDSKNAGGPALVLPGAALSALVASVRA